MEVDPNEELISLRAEVTELQSDRQPIQGSESSRSKNASWFLQGGGAHNPSLVMCNLIEAADSELEFVGRCSVWVAGCPCGRDP